MEILKTTKLMRNGTSLAIVIPKPVLKALDLKRGDEFVFAIYDENTIYLRKLSDADLLKLTPPLIKHDVHK